MITIQENSRLTSARLRYDELKSTIETPDNIGKMIVFDLQSGDYEIDDKGIESLIKLQSKHPGSPLMALRIGYKTAGSFCGVAERNTV